MNAPKLEKISNEKQHRDIKYSIAECAFSTSLVNAEFSEFKLDHEDGQKHVAIKRSNILFQNKDCEIFTIVDQTQILANQTMRHQNNMLNTLTASVSHDMMTPLKCIILYAQYLLTTLMPEQDLQKVIYIKRTAQMLKQQTKDLLDRALIDNKSLTVNSEFAILPALIKEVLGIIAFQAEQSNIKIEFYQQDKSF